MHINQATNMLVCGICKAIIWEGLQASIRKYSGDIERPLAHMQGWSNLKPIDMCQEDWEIYK